VPRFDRLSILVSLVLFGLAVSHLVELPTRTITFVALGVPTTIYLSGRWVIGALLVILTGAGVDSIMRSHPHTQHADWTYSLSFWGLPCALIVLSLASLPLSPSTLFWLGGLAVAGLLLSLIVVAQYYAIDEQARYAKLSRWALNLAAYAGVFLFSAIIYGARVRSLLSATAITIMSTLLAVELLRPLASRLVMRRAWLYSMIVGIVLGEVAWALNHVSLDTAAAGILLLLIFYAVSGLAKQHLGGQLARTVIVEFAFVSILGLGLLCLL
jgi:hypothetical protein